MIAVYRESKTHEAERKLERTNTSCSSRRASNRGKLPKRQNLHNIQAAQQINFVKCRKKELVPNLARSADGEQVMGGGLAAEAPAEEGLGRASVDLVMEL